ncbi:MAG: YXWGXW repeat-containing protein [Planctomycetia bacterium]|nr:YXWGXW repeat-containing protein [Planctomycetia bacterium]
MNSPTRHTSRWWFACAPLVVAAIGLWSGAAAQEEPAPGPALERPAPATATAAAPAAADQLAPAPGDADEAPAPEAAADAQDQDTEVLTTGPIHEAYADPIALNPGPGPVVPRKPPEAIEEVPPTEQPQGERVVWIPGYWQWDPGRRDFLWVSGAWRDAPPDRRWVPGYWTEVEGGFQRVNGFWASVETQELAYLPTPPDSLEQGPTGPAPGNDYVWTPGSWTWRTSRYAWTPGYWMAANPNWIWVPPRYIWTPAGCIYSAGYYDLLLPRRGLLFAPVYYRRPIFLQAGYAFRPGVTWNVSNLLWNVFVWPRAGAYYYGNYYGQTFATVGFVPWYSFYGRRGFYDPLFAYHRWDYARLNPGAGRDGWRNYLQTQYRDAFDHPERRPSTTFAQLEQKLSAEHKADFDKRPADLRVAARLDDVSKAQGLARVSDERINEIREQSKRWREIENGRTKTEVQAAAAGTAAKSRVGTGGANRAGTGTRPQASAARFKLPDVVDPAERATAEATPAPKPPAPRGRDLSSGDAKTRGTQGAKDRGPQQTARGPQQADRGSRQADQGASRGRGSSKDSTPPQQRGLQSAPRPPSGPEEFFKGPDRGAASGSEGKRETGPGDDRGRKEKDSSGGRSSGKQRSKGRDR